MQWRLLLGKSWQIPERPPQPARDRFRMILGNTRGTRFTNVGPVYDRYEQLDGLSVSPTGEHLVRFLSHSRVDIASSASPERFSRIARLSKSDWPRGIHWSADGTEFVYMIARMRARRSPGAEDADYDVYLAKTDGSTPRRIRRYFSRDYLALDIYDWVHRRVFWSSHFDGGGSGRLTVLTLSDGKVARMRGMQEPGLYGRLHFNRDFTRAYATGQGPEEIGDRVNEFTIATGERRTLYRLKNPSDRGYRDLSVGLFDSARNRLIFRIENGYRNYTTYLMTLPGGKIRTLLGRELDRDFSPEGWSPDGKYLWLAPRRPGCSEPLSVDEKHRVSYLMNLSTRRLTRSYAARHCSEQATVIGWLAVS